MDVEGAWRSVHHLGPRGPSARRVAGKIVRAEIGLGFRNRERDTLAADAAHERPSEQLARRRHRQAFRRRPARGRQKSLSLWASRSRAGSNFASSTFVDPAWPTPSKTKRRAPSGLVQDRHMTVATVGSARRGRSPICSRRRKVRRHPLHSGFIVFTAEAHRDHLS